MRRLSLTVLIAMCVSAAAHADSIPTYNMTQGTVVLTSIDISTFSIGWSFGNGSGTNLSGSDSWGTCLDFAPGGGTCNPNIGIGLNQSGASLNGAGVGVFGNVAINGPSFLLPTGGSSFSIALPVLFTGTFITCPYAGPPNGGCTQLNTTGLFNINGTGTVTLNFSGVQAGGGSIWQLTGATYTLNSTPEPSSIGLLGTGALAIFGKLRWRKTSLISISRRDQVM